MIKISTADKFGKLIRNEMLKDKHFYLFSPDETTSNHLDAAYDVTERAWNLKKEDWDLPESDSGRIVEMLSENVLFATMIGHIMNGEQAIMTSYESFFEIIASQIIQQIKFFKQADKVEWRPKYPAVNLLSTSTCWRQDHNGFSHQSPALISTLLSIPSEKVNCLFPIDSEDAESIFHFILNEKNVVNLVTFDKNESLQFIGEHKANELLANGGAAILEKISDNDPDIILTAAGDIAMRECLFAKIILTHDLPNLKIRFVAINALTHNAIGTTQNKLSQEKFDELFMRDRMIFANFHGYSDSLKNILAQYTNQDRLFVHGFSEEGSTTTPFEMLTKNHASRFDIAADIAKKIGRADLVEKYLDEIKQNRKNALRFGLDLF